MFFLNKNLLKSVNQVRIKVWFYVNLKDFNLKWAFCDFCWKRAFVQKIIIQDFISWFNFDLSGVYFNVFILYSSCGYGSAIVKYSDIYAS